MLPPPRITPIDPADKAILPVAGGNSPRLRSPGAGLLFHQPPQNIGADRSNRNKAGGGSLAPASAGAATDRQNLPAESRPSPVHQVDNLAHGLIPFVVVSQAQRNGERIQNAGEIIHDSRC